MNEAKLLSPDELERHLTEGCMSERELRAHIAALEADNAALLAWIDQHGHARWCERAQGTAFRCTDGCEAQSAISTSHPSTALLAEHEKALVRARNEGLETARKMVSNVGLQNLASLIDAAKKSET